MRAHQQCSLLTVVDLVAARVLGRYKLCCYCRVYYLVTCSQLFLRNQVELPCFQCQTTSKGIRPHTKAVPKTWQASKSGVLSRQVQAGGPGPQQTGGWALVCPQKKCSMIKAASFVCRLHLSRQASQQRRRRLTPPLLLAARLTP